MDWIEKNLKYITIIFFTLFLIKSIQSCSRNMSLNTTKKNMAKECDSVSMLFQNNIVNYRLFIDSLENVIIIRDFEIKDLTTELKIAGVKVNAAQRRADAVQKTAESVRHNTTTTIEVKGVEEIKDTTLSN